MRESEYRDVLNRLDGSEEDKKVIEDLITEHIIMIRHMKETSLYDVYMYEQNITNGVRVPMEILVHENAELKKEINVLRKQLKLNEKYREL